MTYDITFCSNTKCENMNCDRNQNNIADDWTKPICIAGFKKCKHWEESNNE